MSREIKKEVHSNKFHWCVVSVKAEADAAQIIWDTSSLVAYTRNVAKCKERPSLQINTTLAPHRHLFPAFKQLKHSFPLAVLYFFLCFSPPPFFPSVLRCRDPSARWCITKDTCSVDVARQIDCVFVCVVCMCAFIHSSIFRLRLGPNLSKLF